ncbi:MAG: hypothetical protein ABIP94_24345 [Planctomycetota bacterium]
MHPANFAFLAIPSALIAQASAGPVLALPHGFSVDAGTALSGGTGKIQFSDIGIDGVLPPSPASPGMPDFATFLGGASVDVDALSLGLDWVLADAAGVAVVPPGQWGAITFSVRRTTLGALGSLIASEVARPDGAAGDIFAYVLPGSSLPPAFVGIPFRAQDSTETSIFVGGVKGNIDAHDVYISLLYLENPQLAVLPPPPTIYFSVTTATAPMIPMVWTSVPSLRSGATVFSTSWSPGTLAWSTPSVALTPASLGILSSEDLDALALDLLRGRVLFSTDPASPPPSGPRNAILYSTLGSGANSVYRLPGGTPISIAIGLGLGPDDVDGICSLDPGSAALPSQIRLPFMMGTIEQPLPLGLPTDLQAVAWRRLDAPTNTEYAVSWMTGWPAPGTPQTSLAIAAGALGSTTGPYVILDVFTRPQPGNQFDGHPEKTRIAIPPSFSLIGQPLYFLWGALSPTSFSVSHPVGVLL